MLVNETVFIDDESAAPEWQQLGNATKPLRAGANQLDASTRQDDPIGWLDRLDRDDGFPEPHVPKVDLDGKLPSSGPFKGDCDSSLVRPDVGANPLDHVRSKIDGHVFANVRGSKIATVVN